MGFILVHFELILL